MIFHGTLLTWYNFYTWWYGCHPYIHCSNNSSQQIVCCLTRKCSSSKEYCLDSTFFPASLNIWDKEFHNGDKTAMRTAFIFAMELQTLVQHLLKPLRTSHSSLLFIRWLLWPANRKPTQRSSTTYCYRDLPALRTSSKLWWSNTKTCQQRRRKRCDNSLEDLSLFTTILKIHFHFLQVWL